jgi:hypothetical protein
MPSAGGRAEKKSSEPIGLTAESPFVRIPLALRVEDAETEAESKIGIR